MMGQGLEAVCSSTALFTLNPQRWLLFQTSQQLAQASSTEPASRHGGCSGAFQRDVESAMGRDGPVPALRSIWALSALRYQEVQVAQRVLDAALTQALLEAETVLDAVQQMDVQAALRPASLAAAALVSWASPGQCGSWGSVEGLE